MINFRKLSFLVLILLLSGCGYFESAQSEVRCDYKEFAYYGGPACLEEVVFTSVEGDFNIPFFVGAIIDYNDVGVLMRDDGEDYGLSSWFVFFSDTDVYDVSSEIYYTENNHCGDGIYVWPYWPNEIGVGDKATLFGGAIKVGDGAVVIREMTVFMIEHMFGGLERFSECSFMVELEKRRPEYR